MKTLLTLCVKKVSKTIKTSSASHTVAPADMFLQYHEHERFSSSPKVVSQLCCAET